MDVIHCFYGINRNATAPPFDKHKPWVNRQNSKVIEIGYKMFDLKEKLLAKGLVTKDQVAKAERDHASKKPTKKNYVDADRQKSLNQLRSLCKNDQYDLIRRWVLNNRLDKTSIDATEKFFFDIDGQVSWLSVTPPVAEQIKNGVAGIIAFYGHHGLSHAAVPRDIVEDVGQVFPTWIRILNDEKA